ncbi:RidA family protein [Streptomyces lincolnensis]|uniref:RidA family protein n=1 Tax=Streptomyces lincolnensis TaxID=1915 RepID=UPI0037CDAA10
MTTFDRPTTHRRPESPKRETIWSSSVWEPQMGYARGVRVGNQIFIAGTVAADGEGNPQGHDAYAQSDFIIRKIRDALRDLGADLEHVVSTVTHLSDFAHFDDYARVHKKYFGETPPVNTTVQADLVKPYFLVEITATAIVPDPAGAPAQEAER